MNSFSDILITLVKWRRFIIINTLVVTVVAIVILLIIPNKYKSSTSILPPKKKGLLFGDFSSSSGKLKDITKALGRLGSSNDEFFDYLTILQSRRASEQVINKFDLRRVYKIKDDEPIEDVLEELKDHATFTVEDEGNITIAVEDENSYRAAKIANFYVKILNEISLELNSYESMGHRVFLEKRYSEILENLKSSEEKLRSFGKQNELISLDDQAKASIKEVAELKGQILLLEIQYELAKNSLGENHPQLSRYAPALEKLHQELQQVLLGSGKGNKENWGIPIDRIADVGIEKIRLMREFEVQAKLYEFVLPIYEQAKMDEKKDLPVCLVLDNAVPAQRKSWPKRGIFTIIIFLLTFLIASLISISVESLRRLQETPEHYQRIYNGIILPLRQMFIRRKS